jgi:hypothetical protein
MWPKYVPGVRQFAESTAGRGPGHEWQTGRYALNDFAPRLFPEKK